MRAHLALPEMEKGRLLSSRNYHHPKAKVVIAISGSVVIATGWTNSHGRIQPRTATGYSCLAGGRTSGI